jgi:thiamine-phosphate pyrophosphorylase
MPSAAIRGIYAITPPRSLSGRDQQTLLALLEGGLGALQYRPKGLTREQMLAEGQWLREQCRRVNCPFIVNDSLWLAELLEADGLHLGRDDGSIAEARQRLGSNSLLGASCYDEPERAARAVADGADLIAFGALFASSTKPGAVSAPLSLLTEARQRWPQVTCVGIGGITPETAPHAVAAGAQALAVIGALWDSDDPGLALQRLQAAFS